MRLRYRARRDHLVRALAEHAPGVRISGTAAGLHLVAELAPGTASADALVAGAARRSLAIVSLERYHHGAGALPPAIVIGYGTPPEHGSRATVDALVAAFADVPGAGRPGPRR